MDVVPRPRAGNQQNKPDGAHHDPQRPLVQAHCVGDNRIDIRAESCIRLRILGRQAGGDGVDIGLGALQ